MFSFVKSLVEQVKRDWNATETNRHDRRKQANTLGKKDSRGKFKYENPTKEAKVGRQLRRERRESN